MVRVKILRDSIANHIRLVSMEIECPTYMALEFLAVRNLCVSRRQWRHPNTMIRTCEDKADIPTPHNSITRFGEAAFASRWSNVRSNARTQAGLLVEAQEPPGSGLVDRMMLPYSVSHFVLTSSQWTSVLDQLNFSGDPEIIQAATMLKASLGCSTTEHVHSGEWHMPYITAEDVDAAIGHVVDDHGVRALQSDDFADHCTTLLTKVSASRCIRMPLYNTDPVARVADDLSVFSGETVFGEKVRLDAYDHQATPDDYGNDSGWVNAHLHGPLAGWCQNRQIARVQSWLCAPTITEQSQPFVGER